MKSTLLAAIGIQHGERLITREWRMDACTSPAGKILHTLDQFLELSLSKMVI
jgi:hypothetical protein